MKTQLVMIGLDLITTSVTSNAYARDNLNRVSAEHELAHARSRRNCKVGIDGGPRTYQLI